MPTRNVAVSSAASKDEELNKRSSTDRYLALLLPLHKADELEQILTQSYRIPAAPPGNSRLVQGFSYA